MGTISLKDGFEIFLELYSPRVKLRENDVF